MGALTASEAERAGRERGDVDRPEQATEIEGDDEDDEEEQSEWSEQLEEAEEQLEELREKHEVAFFVAHQRS